MYCLPLDQKHKSNENETIWRINDVLVLYIEKMKEKKPYYGTIKVHIQRTIKLKNRRNPWKLWLQNSHGTWEYDLPAATLKCYNKWYFKEVLKENFLANISLLQ